MALQEGALAQAFKTIFDSMEDEARDTQWYAERIAKAVTDRIKTAAVPVGTVIVSVTGGSGVPATRVPNVAEIKVSQG
jgi:hypothetical protein